MEFNWIPLKSIGPFKLGDDVDKYVERYNLNYIYDADDNTGWNRYDVSDVDATIYVEKQKIESINCYESCVLNGVELIGLTIEEFIEVVNSKPEDDVDTIDMPSGGIQDVYEFDDLGAQVWVKEGIVVNMFCNPPYEEEDEDEEEESDKA